MATAINVGQGTIMKMTISSSLTAIMQVVEGEGPGIESPKIKITNLANVAEVYRTGLPDPQPLTFTVQYAPTDATHAALVTAVSAFPQVAVAWEVIFNTAAGTDMAAFNGLLTKFGPKGYNQEDNLTADIEVQPVTIPVFT